MISRVTSCKLLLGLAICTCALSHLFSALQPPAAPPPGGIGQASEAAAAKALDLLDSGKLPEAAEAYANLIAKYPTAGVVPEAQYRLGSIQYLDGDYNQAVATLKRIASPPAAPGIKEAADLLIPQILVAEAAKLPAGSTMRKESFDNAIKAYDDFIKAHPDSPQIEAAVYGQAAAEFEEGDYAASEKSLKQNLQRFQNSDTIQNSEQLLASVLTAEGVGLLRKHGEEKAAFEKLNQALPYLANVIQRGSDVALSNDALFQIGEIRFNEAGAEEGYPRRKDLRFALDAYRAVKTNAELIQQQQQRVALVEGRVRQEARGNNPLALEEIQRVQDRETAKLEALKHAPDQTLNAQLRVAACYFLLEKYDEARVLLKYLKPFTGDAGEKKQLAYYLVMTYAAQGLMDKAEPAYNAFMSAYPRDPMGENLPLVMGTAYLSGSNNNAEKAAYYLSEERKLYPNSPMVNDALNRQAAALVDLHRYDEAIATYNKFLATSPPPEQASEAERGIAGIYQQTGKIPEAVHEYQKVAVTFPGTPVAEQCTFYAAGLESTVDVRAALPMLQAYVAKFPKGKTVPQAMLMIGQAQAAQGDTAAAMKTYQAVADRFPETEFGPQAYFQQAALLANQGKSDELVALLRVFIKKYPDNKNIFYAYDTIGQTEVGKGKVNDAIDTYNEMVSQHPDDAMSPFALYRVADLWQKLANSQGRYLALNQEQRKSWDKDVSTSIATVEKLLDKYPDSEPVGVGLKTLVSAQEMRLEAEQIKPEDIDKYFHDLAEKHATNASARSRILFTLATFSYKKNPVLALAQMGVAYNPSLVYAPGDLDLFGSALLDQGKAEQAYKIYQKIAHDYPVPAGVNPAQAAPTIQEAQATALFGMGKALEKEGKTADAATQFTELKTNYPWSPKVLEASFGIAKGMFAQGKLDDASKLLVGIVGSRTAPVGLRAHGLLLVGQIQEAKNNIDAAIDSYLKTVLFYSGVEDAAAEGDWRGGQMLEKQASMLSEQSTPKKSTQMDKAIGAYKNLVTKYPDSPFVKQAQDRLSMLGAQ